MTRTRELAKEFHVVHTRITTAINSDNVHFYRRWAGQDYNGYPFSYDKNGEPMISDSDAEEFRKWFRNFLDKPNG